MGGSGTCATLSASQRRCGYAMFKRAIIGVWHQISGKHMHRYLGEIEFRWNRRRPFESRLATLFGTKSGPLPLKALFA